MSGKAPAACAAIFALIAPAAVLLSAGPATAQNAAQSVESFYKGRTVDMVVGSDAATEYTRDARLLIAHMAQYIPGKPTIIVKNMPGASSIKAANYLYRIAPKDGSVMAIVNKGVPMYEATKLQGVDYTSADFGWIGSMSKTNSVVVTWKTSPVKTIADARRAEAKIGAIGLSGTMAGYPFLMNATLGTKFKVIAGYTGSAAVNLAMERGEVDGRGTYSWDFFKSDNPNWRAEKKYNLLVQIGFEKEPDLPDVPLLTELARDDKQRAVFELISIDSMIARPVLAPPAIPEERLAALRAAFDKAMKDPELLRDAAKMQSTVAPVPGTEVATLVKRVVSVTPDVVETSNEWLSPPK
ncbi:MAG TPA: tripartite tricarboxylate transporter substrate-binding protein [Alphaproteobacteria bacterium]|jgi:tripartite-type tricarboxylate transporter receptor subunit TctC|nr:tripartite tricarboxylate transporter substrate-binding protein [Alphaproteobacteria bacterium]